MTTTTTAVPVQPVSSLEETQVLEGLAKEAHYAISVTPCDRCHASRKLPILPHSLASVIHSQRHRFTLMPPVFPCSCNCFTRRVHEMENDKSRRAGRKRITSGHTTNNPPLPSPVARGAHPHPQTSALNPNSF